MKYKKTSGHICKNLVHDAQGTIYDQKRPECMADVKILQIFITYIPDMQLAVSIITCLKQAPPLPLICHLPP